MSFENPKLRRDIEVGLLPRCFYKIDIDKETKSRMEAVGDLLQRRPELSCALYFNHISFPDPAFAAHVLQQIDQGQPGALDRHWLAPASYSHSDPDNPRSKAFLFLMDEARHCGINILRLIQDYQIDNPEFGYTREQANKTYKDFLRRLQQLHQSETAVASLISPEGHRSDDGKLGQGLEAGLKALGKSLAPIMYVPMAIIYQEPFNRGNSNLEGKTGSMVEELNVRKTIHSPIENLKKLRLTAENLNIGKRVRLCLGRVHIQEEPRDFPGGEYLMKNLAAELPPEMRGMYA